MEVWGTEVRYSEVVKAAAKLPLTTFLLCLIASALGLCLVKKKRAESSHLIDMGRLRSVIVGCLYPSHSTACVTSHVKVPSRSRTSRDHTRSRK